MGKKLKRHGTEISVIGHEVNMRDHTPHGEILEREGTKGYPVNPDAISISNEKAMGPLGVGVTYPYNQTGFREANPRRLYKKGHQFCSPSVPAENLRLFLDGLRKEYKRHPDEMGFGRVIWEGERPTAPWEVPRRKSIAWIARISRTMSMMRRPTHASFNVK